MTLAALTCTASEAAGRAVASPWAFLAFNAAWPVLLLWNVDVTNFAVSILTANLLFISRPAARRSEQRTAREIDELAHVHPDIDDTAIKEEIA